MLVMSKNEFKEVCEGPTFFPFVAYTKMIILIFYL